LGRGHLFSVETLTKNRCRGAFEKVAVRFRKGKNGTLRNGKIKRSPKVSYQRIVSRKVSAGTRLGTTKRELPMNKNPKTTARGEGRLAGKTKRWHRHGPEGYRRNWRETEKRAASHAAPGRRGVVCPSEWQGEGGDYEKREWQTTSFMKGMIKSKHRRG